MHCDIIYWNSFIAVYIYAGQGQGSQQQGQAPQDLHPNAMLEGDLNRAGSACWLDPGRAFNSYGCWIMVQAHVTCGMYHANSQLLAMQPVSCPGGEAGPWGPNWDMLASAEWPFLLCCCMHMLMVVTAACKTQHFGVLCCECFVHCAGAGVLRAAARPVVVGAHSATERRDTTSQTQRYR